jgi:integrase
VIFFIDLHSLRRTCATGLTAGSFGRVWWLEEAQSMLGHASRSTTEIYARYGTTLGESAAQKHLSEARSSISGVSGSRPDCCTKSSRLLS